MKKSTLTLLFAFSLACKPVAQSQPAEPAQNAAPIPATVSASRRTPVVVVATDIHVYDKLVSNIQETRARGAHVIAIATDGNEDIQHHANDVIFVPKSPNFLQAVLATLPLQLLAYRIARLRGLNVDQPRNLAKTVTVE